MGKAEKVARGRQRACGARVGSGAAVLILGVGLDEANAAKVQQAGDNREELLILCLRDTRQVERRPQLLKCECVAHTID